MTTTTIAEPTAFRYATAPPRPSPTVTVEWLAGTEHSAKIGKRIASATDDETFFAEVFRYVSIYLLGPSGENLDAWQKLFGSPRAFVPINAMTLGWMTISKKPQLLRLWNDTLPVVRITSPDFSNLQALFGGINAGAKAKGVNVSYCGLTTSHGLRTEFSR